MNVYGETEVGIEFTDPVVVESYRYTLLFFAVSSSLQLEKMNTHYWNLKYIGCLSAGYKSLLVNQQPGLRYNTLVVNHLVYTRRNKLYTIPTMTYSKLLPFQTFQLWYTGFGIGR